LPLELCYTTLCVSILPTQRVFYMKINRKKGYFSISAVAKMFSIHQQTVRLYEKEGLINPKRSAGNTRLFSEEDVEKLEEVIYLTHELGINLAGVEMILKLKKQIKKMQDDMNKIFESTQEQLEKEATVSKESVKESVKRLALIKKANAPTDANQKVFIPRLSNDELNQDGSLKTDSETDNEEYWQIEYEE
jgi:MerR family transcriptional regulator/heat shock protein HspR